ncbi:hypothetical protein H6G00_33135 [Leptolyngbya sp. FACHB-541]|uniref:hypothetical protein n=1 Tax=Leptolyngbya sp. FACHB-541 TaxID=2692810 RepID=UPI001684E36E|nr:hypothetical protein [Leptolyngbya sp. FACHB-541]MBD2001386.1 hypothetical protein [Leptolyngbya sp. FACHB-541]
MTYQEYITPWVVVRLLPDLRRVVVGRFHKRSDAEGHLQLLQQQMPNSKFVVMFDSLSS